MSPALELITGPARSGKSRWAELLAHRSGLAVHYLATGPQLPEDQAWQERLRRHRQRRPSHWTCQEVGLNLPAALSLLTARDIALVDSLGTWVSAGLDLDQSLWEQHCATMLDSLERCPARVLLVSEQVGWGVVPPTAIGGLFRDRLGSLEDQLSRRCQHLWLVVAGRALDLLPISQAVPPF
jgi:adenosylcobinamide kinase / adenosylcobinamide-phosphate guanylyltransferase